MSEWTDRMMSVLREAAGETHVPRSGHPDERRQHMIDLLESLSFIEARSGEPQNGEDPRILYVVAITTMGRHKLAELSRGALAPGAARATGARRDRCEGEL